MASLIWYALDDPVQNIFVSNLKYKIRSELRFPDWNGSRNYAATVEIPLFILKKWVQK